MFDTNADPHPYRSLALCVTILGLLLAVVGGGFVLSALSRNQPLMEGTLTIASMLWAYLYLAYRWATDNDDIAERMVRCPFSEWLLLPCFRFGYALFQAAQLRAEQGRDPMPIKRLLLLPYVYGLLYFGFIAAFLVGGGGSEITAIVLILGGQIGFRVAVLVIDDFLRFHNQRTQSRS